MKNIIISLIFSVFGISSAFSQMVPHKMDINGLEFGKKYTDAQIRQVLGVPSKYIITDETDNRCIYEYSIQGDLYPDSFNFGEREGFFEFGISSSRFKLYGGRVKVGDNINVFKNLGGGLLKKIDSTTYYFYHSGGEDLQDEYLIIKVNANNIITILSWQAYF